MTNAGMTFSGPTTLLNDAASPSSHAPIVRSMTGQGRASGASAIGTVTIELRTVNNRGFKCSTRLPESLAGMESKFESVIRAQVHRGSTNVSVSIESDQGDTPVVVNEAVLAAYLRQFRSAIKNAGAESDPGVIVNVAAMASMPGVLSGRFLDSEAAEQIWNQVQPILVAALQNLVQMRQLEGTHMAESLLGECHAVAKYVESIGKIAPLAADNYRERLQGKVKRLLADHNVKIDDVDLLREVQIFADKADVSEEITRLDGHLQLFKSVLRGESAAGQDEPTGRRLDFVIQEMFRETNTIGSKSANSDVSALVVEVKCAIERMRELVQNLE